MAQNASWTEFEINENQRPPVRSWAGMCYDTDREVIILHGGWNNELSGDKPSSLNDTWEFDGTTWKQVASDGPSRRGFQMAYDENRGVCVFYSGYEVDNGNWIDQNDTWEWDGQTWNQVAQSPIEPGHMHGLVYDPVRQTIILHGGGTPEQPAKYINTYEWDNNQWSRISSEGHGGYNWLYFDSFTKTIKSLTTARAGDIGYIAQLWELNGNQWTQITNYASDRETPWGRSVAYDFIRNVVVTFGGHGNLELGYAHNFWEDRTMEWDGEMEYEAVTENRPSTRRGAAMVYDPKGKRIILFGGEDPNSVYMNDTWVYKTESSSILNAYKMK